MLTPQSPVINHLRTEQVVPEQPLPQPSKPPFLVQSATLRREIKIPLHLSTMDSNTPMIVEALIDSGATGLFIDIQYVRSKNIWTCRLPRAIPVYNVDGTPNEAGHITEVIDLIVQYKDHSKWVMFHVTSIGQTMIILRHTWLMKYNPEN